MKQTAIDWLNEELKDFLFLFNDDWERLNTIIEQAKEIESQQIIEAFDSGLITEDVYYGYDDKKAEQYYNETYKSKEK
jgi:hypothetical protein